MLTRKMRSVGRLGGEKVQTSKREKTWQDEKWPTQMEEKKNLSTARLSFLVLDSVAADANAMPLAG